MASTDAPTTVKDLLTKVGQRTANIQRHRDAMAEVSAQIVAAQQPAAPSGSGK